MYSIVLMAAMTTGGEVADFGRRGCHGCYGCSGCCGCCYGGSYWGGCSGCWGGCYGSWGGCYGCYGCWGGCYGGGYAWGYSPYHPTMTYSSYYAGPVGYVQREGTTPPTAVAEGSQKASLVVNLPADARLTVNDTPTKQTSSRRVFASPPLDPRQSYYYTLKAEVVRDGQTEVITRHVTVRAGQETQVTLDIPAVAVSARR
jgi:uncharacterized protein (TIGR03000 family)